MSLQTIPATLQEALLARLDRLSTARQIAQLGATLGREFSYELLRAVAPVGEANLQTALAKLVEAEILYQRGVGEHVRYFFKHALIQDTAYQSLLRSTRQRYHQQIAQMLAEQFTDIKETQPELLAHHYTEAGLIEQAIVYWQKAGEQAAQRSAYVEAIVHFTRGLGLLKTLPDTPEHAQQELLLQIALGSSLMATKGYSAPEVERAYSRARELCRHVEKTPQLSLVLHGLRGFYAVRGNFETARQLAEQLLHLAQSRQDTSYLPSWAHLVLAETLYAQGELTLAQEQLEQELALHAPQQPYQHWMWVDFSVVRPSYMAVLLWLFGYPDRALGQSCEALTVTQGLFHPFSKAWSLYPAALFHQLRGKVQIVQEQTEVQLALAAEQGFPLWATYGTILQGWALAERGQAEQGIGQMHQGLEAWQTIGAEYLQPYFLALLADAYGKVGRLTEGLILLVEALAKVNKTGERWYEAELYRLKGELTLQKEFQVQGSKLPAPST